MSCQPSPLPFNIVLEVQISLVKQASNQQTTQQQPKEKKNPQQTNSPRNKNTKTTNEWINIGKGINKIIITYL